MTRPAQLDLIGLDHHLPREILMIFLFFGSSIAPLESELDHFENCQNLSNSLSGPRQSAAKMITTIISSLLAALDDRAGLSNSDKYLPIFKMV